MESGKQSRHIGRKIWYGTAIALSAIILVLSLVGVTGAWVVEQTLSDVSVKLLGAIDQTMGVFRKINAGVDDKVTTIQGVTTNVSDVSQQLSQNVNDQGIIALLLPAEQEQKLRDTFISLQESLATVRGGLTSTIDMYHSLNRLPFVNLPSLSEEQMDNLEAIATENKLRVETLRQDVQDFRSGAAGKIDVITQAVDKITQGMEELSSRLANLDSDLAAVQALAVKLQKVVPIALLVVTILMTLLLAYVIYTQVEMISLFIKKWKQLNKPKAALPDINIKSPAS